MRVAIVVGNPKPKSRTLQVARTLVEHLIPADTPVQIIDLADHTEEIFAWPSDAISELTAQVAASDLVVFATPTYKATYTALLKAFLDRYPANGLDGVIAIPLATGGDLTHALGADTHLVPLLIELGAVVPGRSLYFVTSDMEVLDTVVADAAKGYRKALEKAAYIQAQLAPTTTDETREILADRKAK